MMPHDDFEVKFTLYRIAIIIWQRIDMELNEKDWHAVVEMQCAAAAAICFSADKELKS